MENKKESLEKNDISNAKETTENNSTIIHDPLVSEEDVAHIVASWTGVPVQKLTETESVKLLNMEETLHQRLIGQDEAVKACLLYTSPSPRDKRQSRMPSSA